MASETQVVGAGRSVGHLPAYLAALQRELEVGEQIRVRLCPRPSRAWFVERAQDLIVGAGFQLQGRCIFRSERATATIERIQSLPDSVGPDMRVLIVGLNPSPYSADSGIPYGRPGNRFWPAALGAGLVSQDRDVHHAFSSHHLGFTDFVRRTTRKADEVSQSEFEAGFVRVSRLIEWLKPKVVCFVGLGAWRAVVDKKAVPGLQDRQIGDSRIYVMPHTSGLNAHCRLEDLTGHFAQVKRLITTEAGR